MSVYSYPQSGLIDEVAFRKSEGGHYRAYLHAVPNANSNTLHDIICRLAEEGWQVTPYSMGGKPSLEVHGFGKPEKLVAYLQQKHWVQGPQRFTPSVEDKLSLGQTIRKRSLAASGAFYLVGDASFTRYGYKGGSKLNMLAGGLYGAGTVSLLAGGRKDQSDIQVRDISKQLAEHFRALNIDLPKDCSLEAITEDHKKGLIQKADDLWRRYPSELMNLFFAAAGICIAAAAKKSLHTPIDSEEIGQTVKDIIGREGKKIGKSYPGIQLSQAQQEARKTALTPIVHKYHKLESWLDIGLGTMTSLSGLFAMLVKEKARDPDAPPKHGAAAAWQWIQERPLAIAGMGYMVSTMCHAASTAIAWNYASNERRDSVAWRAAFVGSNIIAEILLAISSKGHGSGVKSDKSVDHTVMSLAAEMIVKQPASMQDGLIDYVANFLGRPETLALKNDEAHRLLRAEVEHMRKNPWALAGPRAAENDKAASILKAAAPAANWQAKVTPDAAAPQISV